MRMIFKAILPDGSVTVWSGVTKEFASTTYINAWHWSHLASHKVVFYAN